MVAILVSVAPAIRAADYVEIAVELKSTWTSQSKTNHHTKTARCVVGTNDWYIAGNFLENAEAHYWLIGTNVIERRINDGLRLCILTAPFSRQRRRAAYCSSAIQLAKMRSISSESFFKPSGLPAPGCSAMPQPS